MHLTCSAVKPQESQSAPESFAQPTEVLKLAEAAKGEAAKTARNVAVRNAACLPGCLADCSLACSVSPPLFPGLVLFCIDADFRVQIRIFSHFSRCTRKILENHLASKFCRFLQKFSKFWQNLQNFSESGFRSEWLIFIIKIRLRYFVFGSNSLRSVEL